MYHSAAPQTINLIDHDNFTPLIHAIVHGHLECIGRLLERSARIDPVSETDHVPLNLACEHGSVAIVELLLKHGAQILADAEGLYPQHLVARSGQTPQLLLLLKNYGADLDQIDKLYGWTPLVHAASEGNVPCLQALLDVGADPNILDEKDLPAMYYAAWEGHLECMKLLAPFNRGKVASPHSMQILGSLQPMGIGVGGSVTTSSAPMPMSLDPDAIPVLELPPPIIPLRRYGHNFLDTKTVVQISFEENGSEQPLVFFQDSKYPAARLTISSKSSDLIPKNVMLPFQEDTRLVSFQIDNLDAFTLDFDVFPTYGAKVIAKTVALPNTFRALLSGSGSGSARCCLPLFDPRLRAIGQISFHTQVIKPFGGTPLEITDFETYWKATTTATSTTDGLGGGPSISAADASAGTFVTGSSLSGDFVRVYVQQTSDGVPVLWPRWTVDCGGIEIPVSRLTASQFSTVTSRTRGESINSSLANLFAFGADRIAEIHNTLATAGVTLEESLALLPRGMHVNIQVLYPSPEEEKEFGLGGPNTRDINEFADAILNIVFDHARAQRASRNGHAATPGSFLGGGAAGDAVRSVVFSSYHPGLCTALNWKQPNFPVFLCNDLGRQQQQQQDGTDDREMTMLDTDDVEITSSSDGAVVVGAVEEAGGVIVQGSGRRTSSIKDVVRTAQSNNFMGLIVSSRLLVSFFKEKHPT